MTLHPVEAAFVSKFIARAKRDRWTQLLGHPPRRRDITSVLCHALGSHLDAIKAIHVPSRVSTADYLAAMLEDASGATQCRVISDGPLDQRDLTISEAIGAEHGMSSGTLICAVSGAACLWMPEPIAENVLLVESAVARRTIAAKLRRDSG